MSGHISREIWFKPVQTDVSWHISRENWVDLLTSRCLWKIPWLHSNVAESGGVCFVDLDLLTFWPRGVLADSYHYRRYVGVDAKRHTSKSALYNAMMRYASYSLHAWLRFSRCMHEHSTARFQSASRVKMWDSVSFRERGKFHDIVRTFQKRRKKLHEKGSIRVTNPNPNRQLNKYKRSVISYLSLGLLTTTNRVRIRVHYRRRN